MSTPTQHVADPLAAAYRLDLHHEGSPAQHAADPLAGLAESDLQLIRQGLELLEKQQSAALQEAKASGIKPGGRDFQPWDFGLPQITRLIARIDG